MWSTKEWIYDAGLILPEQLDCDPAHFAESPDIDTCVSWYWDADPNTLELTHETDSAAGNGMLSDGRVAWSRRALVGEE